MTSDTILHLATPVALVSFMILAILAGWFERQKTQPGSNDTAPGESNDTVRSNDTKQSGSDERPSRTGGTSVSVYQMEFKAPDGQGGSFTVFTGQVTLPTGKLDDLLAIINREVKRLQAEGGISGADERKPGEPKWTPLK